MNTLELVEILDACRCSEDPKVGHDLLPLFASRLHLSPAGQHRLDVGDRVAERDSLSNQGAQQPAGKPARSLVDFVEELPLNEICSVMILK